jgi:hypothetical protein
MGKPEATGTSSGPKRDLERAEVGLENLVEPKGSVGRGFLHFRELTHHNAGEMVERTDRSKVRQHPIHSVEILSDVFDEENGALEIREIGCPNESLEEGQIPACEWTFGRAGSQGHDPSLACSEHIVRGPNSAQTPSWRRVPNRTFEVLAAEPREICARNRAVERDDPGDAGHRVQEGRDIRIPNQNLGDPGQRLVVHGMKDTGDAVAPAQTPDCVDSRVADGAVEIGQPLLVGATQIAVFLSRVRAHLWLESERPAHLGGAPQVIMLEDGPGRSH